MIANPEFTRTIRRAGELIRNAFFIEQEQQRVSTHTHALMHLRLPRKPLKGIGYIFAAAFPLSVLAFHLAYYDCMSGVMLQVVLDSVHCNCGVKVSYLVTDFNTRTLACILLN